MTLQLNDTKSMIDLLPVLSKRARRLCQTQSDADDIVQDTVVSLLKSGKNIAEIEKLPNYALTVLRRHAYRQWQSKIAVEQLEENTVQVAPDAMLRLVCAETETAIARLPPQQAKLMRLVVAGETRPKELAELTDVPLGTVMSRLARARANLRTDLNVPVQASVSHLLS